MTGVFGSDTYGSLGGPNGRQGRRASEPTMRPLRRPSGADVTATLRPFVCLRTARWAVFPGALEDI